ncbi:MAG TPA: Rieske (2Fe-2S) protein [Solirubrobacteraceae bacterium]|jgi:3-phenylpropionate/trans-cinnamate dioxygenase ferredoxin subunit
MGSRSGGGGGETTRARRAYPVGSLDEIAPGGRKLVTVAGRSIGVFNVQGRFFAVRNRCPHQGGPLCLGPTTGLLRSEKPGERCFEREGEILRCPWHGWEFDMRDGRSVVDPERTRVRSYEVVVGELTAETYPVEVEGDTISVLL